MEVNDNKVSNMNIAYIGGGSRAWAWKLMNDLGKEKQLSGNIKLYDIDFDAAYANEVIGNRLSNRSDAKGKWNYKAVKKLEEALVGSDFVIVSILPGTFDEMESDVHLPEKYGIYQSVGDTVGPGGLVRALRTIPMFVEIAEAIKKYSPKAWVINYTNPMSLCTRTLYEIFPKIKAFGCCHEVFGTQELLTYALQEVKGIENVNRADIRTNVLGINHFTWIDRASYKDIDLFPVYKKFANKYRDVGYVVNGKDIENDYFAFTHKIKFDLFRRYGLIAAAGDRHLAEFMPPIYLKNPETVKRWGFHLTPVSYRKETQRNLKNKSKKLMSGEEEIELKETGEESIKQIKAILGLGDFVTNVNLPNQGQMKDIPYGSIIETNALFSRDNVTPVIAGRLPNEIQSLVIRHIYNQETVLNAALNKDKEMAFRAFINEPLVNIGVDEARELFETMLHNTSKYLPGWDL